jgi:hypothetical protein
MHALRRATLIAAAALGLAIAAISCGGGSRDNPSAVKPTPQPTPNPVKSEKEILLDKIRAGMAAAAIANTASSAPLAPPSVWTPDTEFAQGQVVRGTGEDADHQYISIFSTGKSSATGSGPSGSGYAPIVDGAVTWYYAGPVRTQLIDPTRPQVRSGDRPALLADLAGYQTFTPTVENPLVLYSGGVVEPDPAKAGIIAVRGSNYKTVSAPLYVSTSSASMTFWTDSSAVVLGAYNIIYKNQGLVVEVNDRLVDDSQFIAPATANPGAFRLDFTPGSTTPKKIRLMSAGGFGGVAHQIFIEQGARLWTEPNPHHWRLAVEGDSLTQGGYYSPYHAGLDWVSQVGRLLGCDDVANMAQGGTGFINDGNGTKTTYIQRIERLASLNADVYVIAGNHNDIGYPAQDQIDAALTYFKKLRLLQPKAIIVVAGVNPLQGERGDSGNVRAGEVNLKAAFDRWADANAYFLPISTDPDGPWITGTGSVDAPTGDGNKDMYYIKVDGHPLQRGVDYFAQRYAQALRKVLLGS